jgi:hypothetical protein
MACCNKKIIITEDEKKHILGMYGVILEQDKIKTETQEKVIKLDQLYADGYYSITKDKEGKFKSILDSQLLPILKQYPNTKLNIDVRAGESISPNYDYELNDGQKKEDMYLANLRRDKMIDFLNKYFQSAGLETLPNVSDAPNTTGTNVWRGRSGRPNNSIDRFVEVVIDLNVPGLCLNGLKIEVIYDKSPATAEFPCRGKHKCDKARFNVKLNGVVIGEANLNNLKDGESRIATLIVNSEQATTIGGNSDKILLALEGIDDKPHDDVPEVRITDPKGNVIFHGCCSILQGGKGKDRPLLQLDKCGTKVLLSSKAIGIGAEQKDQYGRPTYTIGTELQLPSNATDVFKNSNSITQNQDGTITFIKDLNMTKYTFRKGQTINPKKPIIISPTGEVTQR